MKRTIVTTLLLSAAVFVCAGAKADGLAARISHYDVTKTSNIKAVHDGAGSMNFGALMNDKTITDRKSTRLNSSHMSISYAVFCLKKKNKNEQAVRLRTLRLRSASTCD